MVLAVRRLTEQTSRQLFPSPEVGCSKIDDDWQSDRRYLQVHAWSSTLRRLGAGPGIPCASLRLPAMPGYSGHMLRTGTRSRIASALSRGVPLERCVQRLQRRGRGVSKCLKRVVSRHKHHEDTIDRLHVHVITTSLPAGIFSIARTVNTSSRGL